MNYLKTFLLFFASAFLFVSTVQSAALTPEESLRKKFPDLPFDSFRASPIKGLYEVNVGIQIYYYSPETEILVVGQFITKDRHNLTAERRLELITARMKELPLEKALKIGNGKNQVIEFSYPDCSHCRHAAEFFLSRSDVTRHIFFFPLSPESESKVRYILCSSDREKAYQDAYAGKIDKVKFEICKDEKIEELLLVNREAVSRLGLDGTPFFFINGKAVAGADLAMMTRLLEAKIKP
jgi:thiol:disulfide interchange protein DsbC